VNRIGYKIEVGAKKRLRIACADGRASIATRPGHRVATSSRPAACAGCRCPSRARRWALPFPTVLAPSARWSEAHCRKTLVDSARQAMLRSRRWLGKRRVVIVADSSFAALDLIPAMRRHVCLITRLRLDAICSNPLPNVGPVDAPAGVEGQAAAQARRRAAAIVIAHRLDVLIVKTAYLLSIDMPRRQQDNASSNQSFDWNRAAGQRACVAFLNQVLYP